MDNRFNSRVELSSRFFARRIFVRPPSSIQWRWLSLAVVVRRTVCPKIHLNEPMQEVLGMSPTCRQVASAYLLSSFGLSHDLERYLVWAGLRIDYRLAMDGRIL
jgi:hypothetical protein